MILQNAPDSEQSPAPRIFTAREVAQRCVQIAVDGGSVAQTIREEFAELFTPHNPDTCQWCVNDKSRQLRGHVSEGSCPIAARENV